MAALAESTGGFVVSSSQSGEKESISGFISFRVPTESTRGAIARIRSLAVRVTSENSDNRDVTEEYEDVQARLRNLQATEDQLVALLDRADTVEDILKVRRELSSVREEIERLQGRAQYLERTTATSLIRVAVVGETSPAPLVRDEWAPVEIAKEAVRALTVLGQELVSLGIWLVIFSPVWAGLLVVAFVVMRWSRRRRAARLSGGAPRPLP